MDFSSLISGLDSLKKFFVATGIILVVGGILYPIKASLQLSEKRNSLIESKGIFAVDSITLDREVKIMENVISINKKKCSLLKIEKDTLNWKNPFEKERITEIERRISDTKRKDNKTLDELDIKYDELDKSHIKIESLKRDIEIYDNYISRYWWFQFIAIGLGVILLFVGLYKWLNDEISAKDIVLTEHEIRKAELKKLRED